MRMEQRMTLRWTIIMVALAVGLSVTAVAQAQHGSQSSAPLISTSGAIDAIHATRPTWGTDGRPEYAGIAFAPDGTLYAVDPLNGRVYKVTSRGPWGQTTVVAGSGPGVSLGKGGYQHWKRR